MRAAGLVAIIALTSILAAGCVMPGQAPDSWSPTVGPCHLWATWDAPGLFDAVPEWTQRVKTNYQDSIGPGFDQRGPLPKQDEWTTIKLSAISWSPSSEPTLRYTLSGQYYGYFLVEGADTAASEVVDAHLDAFLVALRAETERAWLPAALAANATLVGERTARIVVPDFWPLLEDITRGEPVITPGPWSVINLAWGDWRLSYHLLARQPWGTSGPMQLMLEVDELDRVRQTTYVDLDDDPVEEAQKAARRAMWTLGLNADLPGFQLEQITCRPES